MTLIATSAGSGATAARDPDRPISIPSTDTAADRVFTNILRGSGMIVLALVVGVAIFLGMHGWSTLHLVGIRFITDPAWDPPRHRFGVGSLILGSIAIAIVSVILAFPISLSAAIMINEYAPALFRWWLTVIVDMLATIPSIVYGFWGLAIVSNAQVGPARWLATHFGFILFLRTPSPGQYIKSIFATSLVCALTIIPIITSVSREVMAQTPRDACEAALGLGGTRWGMVTSVVLPFSRNGIAGAALLGLGRGLGETMIPFLILSAQNIITPKILGPNGLGSIASEIVQEFVNAGPQEQSALVLAALALFTVTLLVNAFARKVVVRSATSKS